MMLLAMSFMNGPLAASDYYPPRISRIDGTAAYEPAGEVDWEELTINVPLLDGDRVFSHVDSRMEIDLGRANFLRLGAETDVAFTQLTEKESALTLNSGSLIVRINRDHAFRIETPDGVVTVKKDGLYRIDARDGRPTEVVVRKGRADVDSAAGRARIESGERMVLAPGPSNRLEVTYGYYEDSLDNWSDRRDASYVSSASVAYVGNSYYPGVWDLDYYGSWDYYPGYGRVWIPRVSAGWIPFHYGSWSYRPRYGGYTWVSYDPWGWLPYHYGHWLYWGSRWCWLPGSFSVWAAAPVNFYYGGGYVGWMPRGFYGVGSRGGTTIINNNTVIVNNNNGHIPGPGRRGLTVVRQTDFSYGRSIHDVTRNVRNESNIQWRSGLPSRENETFRETRRSVTHSDRYVAATAPDARARRSVGSRTAAAASATRMVNPRNSTAGQRNSRSLGGSRSVGAPASSATSPSTERVRRGVTSAGSGRTTSSGVRTYSVGERAPASNRESQERTRVQNQIRNDSNVRSVPRSPTTPSSRMEPPVVRSRSVRPTQNSYREATPRTNRSMTTRERSSSSMIGRTPSSNRSTYTVPRSSTSRPAVSRPSVSRPAVSRPSVSRPSVSRPSVSSSRPSSSRPANNGSTRTRPDRH